MVAYKSARMRSSYAAGLNSQSASLTLLATKATFLKSQIKCVLCNDSSATLGKKMLECRD
jgi:hypothetical protein